MSIGVVIVDHGSRSVESNAMLHEVARRFAGRFGGCFPVVEPAHMEISEPSILRAFERCVARGATRIVVVPFFLGPGKHMREDIPRLVQVAALHFPGVACAVASPLGMDELMLQLLDKRAREAMAAMAPSGV